jgi:hypothetical protein
MKLSIISSLIGAIRAKRASPHERSTCISVGLPRSQARQGLIRLEISVEIGQMRDCCGQLRFSAHQRDLLPRMSLDQNAAASGAGMDAPCGRQIWKPLPASGGSTHPRNPLDYEDINDLLPRQRAPGRSRPVLPK